jgi:hypothetical protein
MHLVGVIVSQAFFTSCTLFLHLRLAAGSNFVYDADARLALHQRTEGFV